MTKSYKNLVYREEGISNSGNSAVGKVFFFLSYRLVKNTKCLQVTYYV